MATGADVVMRFLAEAGVRRLYGLPGEGASLRLLEAARRAGVEFVLVHQGAAAAIMAATEGDLLGQPGVCLTAQGSGALAAAPGVAHAYLYRAPLLVLTDRDSRPSLRLASRQLDQRRVFEEISKDTATLTAGRAERLLRWAWDRAIEIPSGPVHLDLPADEVAKPARWRGLATRGARPPSPSPHAVRTAARLLARRGRALAVAGLGCRSATAARALQELVEHLGTPLFTTQKAKGVVPEDHPLSAGVFMGGRLEEQLLAKAEAILAIGLDPVELLPRRWRTAAPVVAVAETPDGARPYEAAAEVVGDLQATLDALRTESPPGGGWNQAEWAGRGERFKRRVRALVEEASSNGSGDGLPPHRIVEIARRIFPRETIATLDVGAHAVVASVFWDSFDRRGFLCSGGLAALGHALPAAIAAKLALPDRPALALTGDAGLLASLGELATLARLGLPVTILVFLDGALSLTRVLQEQHRYPAAGVSLHAGDLPRLAEGLGLLATEVEEEESLSAALQDALAGGRPALIAARVRASNYRGVLDILRGRREARASR